MTFELRKLKKDRPTQNGKTPYQLHTTDALLFNMDIGDDRRDVQMYIAIIDLT